MVMDVREIDRFLEQWQIGVTDLRRRMILALTPRERWYAILLLAQGWTAAEAAQAWDGILTPLDDGPPPLAFATSTTAKRPRRYGYYVRGNGDGKNGECSSDPQADC